MFNHRPTVVAPALVITKPFGERNLSTKLHRVQLLDNNRPASTNAKQQSLRETYLGPTGIVANKATNE